MNQIGCSPFTVSTQTLHSWMSRSHASAQHPLPTARRHFSLHPANNASQHALPPIMPKLSEGRVDDAVALSPSESQLKGRVEAGRVRSRRSNFRE